MDLDAVKMFSLLAVKLNYTETAKALDVSQPTLSRKIKSLEQSLKVTLFHRRGSSICLTPQGEAFFKSSSQILDVVEQSLERLHAEKKGDSGLLRVGCLHPMARFLTQRFLPDFHQKYPGISLHFQTLPPDTLERFEDVDLMISPIKPTDETVVCKTVSHFQRYCYASPEYLAKHGQPKTIPELELHQCITQTITPTVEKFWRLRNKKGDQRIAEVNGHMTTNSVDIAIDLALGGFGIGLIPESQTIEWVKQGKLVKLFDGEWFEDNEMYIMFKQNIYTPNRYKIFIEEFAAFQAYWHKKAKAYSYQ